MTAIESKPESATSTEVVAVPPSAPLPAPPPAGPAGVFGTSDHKTVGRLYLGCSLLLLAGALVLAGLVGLEGVDANSIDVLTGDSFFQIFTLSQVSLIFLGVLPAFVGLGTYLVPLQVGAATIAFPRAAAAAFWTWLMGAGLLVAAYAVNGGPAGGEPEGVLLFLAGFAVVIAALLLGVVCIITTVVTARPAGMTMLRVPAFSWAMLVAGALWILNLAALLANLAIVYVDADHAAVLYGRPADQWPQLAWIFAQPAVLSFAIPVLGIAADVVPVMARFRSARHGVVLGTIGAFGALSFGAYAQRIFNPEVEGEALFVLQSLLVVLPLLALLGGLADVMRRGRLRLRSPLLLAEVGLLLLLVAAGAAAVYAFPPFNLAYTAWGGAVMKAVVAAALSGVAAGLFYWGGKIWGHQVAEPLGALCALVFLGGGVAFAAGDIVAGAGGQLPTPSSGVAEVVEGGAEVGALISAIGAGLLLVGVVLTIVAVLPAVLRKGAAAPADPWDGHTLEWATASPPPFGNFAGPIMTVGSAAPLLDARTPAAEEASR